MYYNTLISLITGQLEQLFILIAFFVVFRGLGYIINIIKAFGIFQSEEEFNKIDTDKKKINLHILIPLYLEQNTIKKMLKHFSRMPHSKLQKVYFVTTEKEGRQEGSTYEVLNKVIENDYNKLKDDYFNVIHYPYEEGVMSHQLNYAYKEINEKIPDIDKNMHYISIYNADSEPDINTFIKFNALAQENKPVYQQVAIFLQNYKEYGNSITSNILKASAVIQTRWSLGFEIEMFIRYFNFWKNDRKESFWNDLMEPFVYCVGHGLYIRSDILDKVGLFPSDTMNEDLPLGYYLGLNKVPVSLFPLLESADNPSSLRDLINQKSSWYWGMIDYSKYMKIAKKKNPNISNRRLVLSTIKGYLNGTFSWGGASFATLLLIIYPLFNPQLFGLSFVAFLMYLLLPVTLSILFYNRRVGSSKSGKIPLKDYYIIPFFSIVYLFISSFGPWKTLYMIVKEKLFGTKAIKYKTPR